MIHVTSRIPYVLLLLVMLVATAPVSAITLTPGNSFSGVPSIANGDPVYIHGIATGHPQQGLQIWLFGNNYAKITTVSTNADNTYEYELTSADTLTLSPGQYFVLIQHPMMNGVFDVYYDPGTGSVINRQLGSGMSIFQLTGGGSLQTTAGANALMDAISSQNIDGATVSFIVNPPTAIISPVGDHRVGDPFTVSGSTNLAVGDTMVVEITSSSFKPTSKSQSAEFSGASGMVTVVPGTGALNRWSFPVDASTFKPDKYIVKMSGTTIDISASTLFNIYAVPLTTAAVPTPVITLQTSIPVVTTGIPTTIPTTKKSPVPVFVILGAVGLVAIVMIADRK
ncbi:MAG: hypothetical protein WCF90_02595 [Methanomicrobiales archaeon]